MINRILDLDGILNRKSQFLLGPRQTGKSTWIKHSIKPLLSYSLLEQDLFLRLSRDPAMIRREADALVRPQGIVVIDEIQRIPELLNEVHSLIEKYPLRFLLTGSNARKLRKGGVNLLGGRASQVTFHPLSAVEIGLKNFNLLQAMSFGLLPPIYLSDQPEEDLKDYTQLYVREEILQEGIIRKLPQFSRFLEVAALSNGQMINFASVASDAQISPSVCYEYFQILKDTLMTFEVPAWQESKKRKAIATSRFYFFDSGVARSLMGRAKISRNDADYGAFFEAFIFHELQTYSDYHRLGPVQYWRSTSQFEVDFIFNDSVAIEVKATRNPAAKDLKGLNALAEEKLIKKMILVCDVERSQKLGVVQILPWREFIESLWGGDFTK